MKVGKIVLDSINPNGLRQVLNSQGAQNELFKHALQIQGRTGKPSDYTVSVQPGMNRAHGRVETNSAKAFHRERATNRLLKAVGGGKPR